MAQGKYSPTVSFAYGEDQSWWSKYSFEQGDNYVQYDPEGYDSYGYDKYDVDRAGYNEFDYIGMDPDQFSDIQHDWGFDGVKPVVTEYKSVLLEQEYARRTLEAIKWLESQGYTVTKG